MKTSEAPQSTTSTTSTSMPKFDSSYDRLLWLISQNRFQLSEHFLVARIDIQQQVGSIILPDVAQHETNTATIIVIAANLDKATFPIGAHCIPAQHTGRELASKGNARLVLYDVREDVHAVFIDEA